MQKVIRLQQHIAEFGIRNALIAVFEAAADRLFGNHIIDAEMFAHIAQPVDITQGCNPVMIVGHQRRLGALKTQKMPELGADFVDVFIHFIVG